MLWGSTNDPAQNFAVALYFWPALHGVGLICQSKHLSGVHQMCSAAPAWTLHCNIISWKYALVWWLKLLLKEGGMGNFQELWYFSWKHAHLALVMYSCSDSALIASFALAYVALSPGPSPLRRGLVHTVCTCVLAIFHKKNFMHLLVCMMVSSDSGAASHHTDSKLRWVGGGALWELLNAFAWLPASHHGARTDFSQCSYHSPW